VSIPFNFPERFRRRIHLPRVLGIQGSFDYLSHWYFILEMTGHVLLFLRRRVVNISFKWPIQVIDRLKGTMGALFEYQRLETLC